MPTKRRTFLDEAYTQPYNSVAPIRTDQGEIKADTRSNWRRFQDNLVKRVSESKDPLVNLAKTGIKTALGATMLINPMETLAFLAGSGLTRKAADTAAEKLTGRNTTQLLSDSRADLNPQIAEIVNPVNFAGGLSGISLLNQLRNTEANAAANWARSRFSGPRVTVDAQGNVLTPTVENLPSRAAVRNNLRNTQYVLETNTDRQLEANNNLQLEANDNLQQENIQTLALPEPNRTNYGSTIVLPSTTTRTGKQKIFRLGDKDINYRRNFLAKMNRFFNSHYGYNSIPLETAADKEATEAAIKSILNQHNTTVRGVRDRRSVRDKTNTILQQQGIEPTAENRLRYYATHYAGDTGSGRAGYRPGDFTIHPDEVDEYGTIYTSNMPGVGKGYAFRDVQGGVYEVQRPVDYSSDKYEDWVLNADFPFYSFGKRPHTFYSYELPYAMRTGMSLRSAYRQQNPVNYNYKERANYYRRMYPIRSYLEPNWPAVRMYNQTMISLGLTPKSLAYGEGAQAVADGIYLADVKKAIDSEIKKLNDPTLYASIYTDDGFNLLPERTKQRIIGRIKSLSSKNANIRRIQTVEKEHEKALRKHFKRDIATATEIPDNALREFYLNEGYEPAKSDVMAFGDGSPRRSTKNTGNPQQHIVYVGRVGDQGLNIIRRLEPEDMPGNIYPNMHSDHYGTYAPWLSRKSRKFGGAIKM